MRVGGWVGGTIDCCGEHEWLALALPLDPFASIHDGAGIEPFGAAVKLTARGRRWRVVGRFARGNFSRTGVASMNGGSLPVG